MYLFYIQKFTLLIKRFFWADSGMACTWAYNSASAVSVVEIDAAALEAALSTKLYIVLTTGECVGPYIGLANVNSFSGCFSNNSENPSK